MIRKYSVLLCFLTILIISAKVHATTATLNPYLVVSTRSNLLAVNYTAFDFPLLSEIESGQLFTKDQGTSSLSIWNGNRNRLDPILFVTSSGVFFSIPNDRTENSCEVPLIPLRDVSGPSFPISYTPATEYACIAGLPPPHAVPNYSVSYNAPAMVTVADGNHIESVKISISADGLPWADYIFGYRIGLIQMAAAPATALLFSVPTLNVLTLPPPLIEGSVVEYNNTIDFPTAPGGHFFYSSDATEQSYVDSGQAGHFQRTGRSFNTGGYVPVCRFYGSQTPGPNSHFFSADQTECAGLRALQKTPTPTDTPQWNDEGNGFYAVAIVTDVNGNRSCLTGTVPVYRAYNNAYSQTGKRNVWDSNHRFSTSHAEIDQLVNNHGWSDEGIAFCAPR